MKTFWNESYAVGQELKMLKLFLLRKSTTEEIEGSQK